MSSAPRIFISQELETNQSFPLSSQQSHHLSNVLRLKVGDEIEVVGRNSKAFKARIQKIDKIMEAQTLAEIRQAEIKANITLLIATCKGEKNDLIIEKGTELGVSEFIFFQSEHSIGKLTESHRERFIRKAEAAAGQSRRCQIPEVQIFKNLGSAQNMFSQTTKIVFALSNDAKALQKSNIVSKDILLAIGPEGDFSPAEYQTFKQLNFFEASLGPTILRSETAAIAAIAGVLALVNSA